MGKKTKSTIFHDKIAEAYESSYTEPFWQLYFKVTWHNLKKYLPQKKGAKVLDAGGGTGFWSRKLAERDYHVVCSDIAPKMLDVGSKLAEKEKLEKKKEFKHLDIANMKCFEDNSFDMVVAQGDPVGYCGDPQKALNELTRVAKKGAHVSVSIDSFYARLGILLSQKDFKQIEKLLNTNISEFDNRFTQYNFTLEELKKMFETSGLKVVDAIGKLVFIRFIPRNKINEMLSDKTFFNKIYEIEIKFNNDPSVIGQCGHIQMIGKK